MAKKNNNTKRIELVLLTIVITLFSMCFISSAGFGSSYLPKVDGESQLSVPIGSNVSYFIYPQNMESKTLLVKIDVTDENNTLLNTLQDYYEVPPNTSSDDIKIELVFALANDTTLIGKKFPVSYSVLSTYKTNESSTIVSFSPMGFSKTFYVVGKDPVIHEVIPPIIEQVLTSSSSGSGGGGGSSKTKKITTTTTTNPTEEISPNIDTPPIPPLENPVNDTTIIGIPISGKTIKTFAILIFIGLIAIVGIIFTIKKFKD